MMTNRIARLLDRAPADFWAVGDEGRLLPTLDLYLYLANELGIDYAVRVGPIGDLWQAVATLKHGDRTIAADAIAHTIDDDADTDTDSPPPRAGEGQGVRTETKLSQLQSRALLKAFRLYLYPCIRACQPDARRILLATAQILYRERGYDRDTRLRHASEILSKPVQSFRDLANTDLAELIVALTLDEVSSQYDS
jgi:hypothetical protein